MLNYGFWHFPPSKIYGAINAGSSPLISENIPSLWSVCRDLRTFDHGRVYPSSFMFFYPIMTGIFVITPPKRPKYSCSDGIISKGHLFYCDPHRYKAPCRTPQEGYFYDSGEHRGSATYYLSTTKLEGKKYISNFDLKHLGHLACIEFDANSENPMMRASPKKIIESDGGEKFVIDISKQDHPMLRAIEEALLKPNPALPPLKGNGGKD
ncbi:hypothetical protein Tco_0894220 [Tanacetum coccineum]|uniref:Uncharacterized protein n=1 Tax=Tanacetum coccineum TaxID=301880 RepID=A0ABQ5CEA4_9ASTR